MESEAVSLCARLVSDSHWTDTCRVKVSLASANIRKTLLVWSFKLLTAFFISLLFVVSFINSRGLSWDFSGRGPLQVNLAALVSAADLAEETAADGQRTSVRLRLPAVREGLCLITNSNKNEGVETGEKQGGVLGVLVGSIFTWIKIM